MSRAIQDAIKFFADPIDANDVAGFGRADFSHTGCFGGMRTMNAETVLTIERSGLIAALLERERLLDKTQHWIGLRVRPDGKVDVAEEVSYCIGEDEFNHRMPHTVTCLGRFGAGGCCLEDGWEDEFDPDYLEKDIVAALKNAGYEVEVV